MDYQSLSQKVRQYLQVFFESNSDKKFAYHNSQHTENVVKAAVQIANHYQLSDHNFFVVTTAAWFHDAGYYVEDGKQHELKGAEVAGMFLQQQGVNQDTINQVKQCIIATQLPQKPVSLLDKIVCDADLFHLGTDSFSEIDKLMRRECEMALHKEISKKEWRKGTIELFQSHHYHTEYCQVLLNSKKQENLDRLINKQRAMAGETNASKVKLTETHIAESMHDTKGKKVKRPVRGIETMFRVASTNHQRLSDMADSKAHIMISVNSIIISVVIGLVVRRLETTHNLVIPTLILLGGCVTAVIFSVLATRPKIPNGYFKPEQLSNRTVNLLFFGNFYNMDYEHYYDGMKQVMNDSEFLYASLIRDIHSQGVILGHKYKKLRISYTIFMYTLIISVAAFAMVSIFFS